MRIRTIKPEFWTSESVGRLSRDARLLFIALWSFADDSGKGRGAFPAISGALFPYDADAAENMPRWFAELEREGMVRRYRAADGNHYFDIPKWSLHQKIEKPSRSRLPDFTEHSPNPPRTLPEISGSGPRTLDLGTGEGGTRAHAPARGEVTTPPPPLETHGQDPEPEPEPAPFPEDSDAPETGQDCPRTNDHGPDRPETPGNEIVNPGVNLTALAQPADPAARKAVNRERLRTALGREGLAFHGDAFQEWQHALQGIAGCKTIEDCLAAVVWLGTAARKTGRAVRYLKDCKDLLEAWGRQRRAST